eukprot:1149915-Pelagomonas_calceolata.AAC.3
MWKISVTLVSSIRVCAQVVKGCSNCYGMSLLASCTCAPVSLGPPPARSPSAPRKIWHHSMIRPPKSSLSIGALVIWCKRGKLEHAPLLPNGCKTASEPHIAPPCANFPARLDVCCIRRCLVCSGRTKTHAGGMNN